MPFIQCGELEIYYNAPRGLPASSSDQLVLLVHGAGGSSRHWEPVLAVWTATPLPEQIFPVALDLPGHGNSSGTVLKSVAAIAEFLNAFLDQLHIKNPICYIGHSAGGLLGLQFALSYPDRVAQLVLIATFAQIQLHPDFLQQALTGAWDYPALQQSFAPEVPEELQHLVLHEFQHLRLSSNVNDFMDLSNVDLRSALSGLQVPALIITGDDDVIISPRKSKLLHRELPMAELVTIPAAGHYVHVERAATVAVAIDTFLQQSQLAACPV